MQSQSYLSANSAEYYLSENRIGSKIIYKTILAAIAHVIVKEILQHFIVVYRVGWSTLEYMNPGDGRMHKVSHEDFKKKWTDVLVLVEPKKTFVAMDKTMGNVKRFWQLYWCSIDIWLLQAPANSSPAVFRYHACRWNRFAYRWCCKNKELCKQCCCGTYGKYYDISLLQNIYPIQRGKIKIGDYDIGRIANKSLREKVCVVP